MSVYPFIEAEKAGRRNVKRACELLKVSRAAFYEYLKGPSGRGQQDADLAAKIAAVHEESKGRYGAPRVHAELRRRGHRHGRKRVARLMRQAGLQGRAARRWKKTTIPDPCSGGRSQGRPDPPRLHRRRRPGELSLVRRHHLHLHVGGVAVPGHRHRHRLPPRRRLRDGRSPAHRTDR